MAKRKRHLYPAPCKCNSTVNLTLQVIQTHIPVTKESDELYAGVEVDALQWLRCPSFVAIPNATQIKLSLSGHGTYALRVENKGCADTIACINFNTTQLSSIDEKELLLYPNPIRETLNIEGSFDEEIHVEVFTLLGQAVFNGVVQPETIIRLDMSGLPAGKYIIRISEKK